MDLKGYFKRLREMLAQTAHRDIYITSLATADGGRAGVVTEVPAIVGCELIVLGRARLATPSEIVAFEKEAEQQRAAAAALECANRVQVQVVPAATTTPASAETKSGKN